MINKAEAYKSKKEINFGRLHGCLLEEHCTRYLLTLAHCSIETYDEDV